MIKNILYSLFIHFLLFSSIYFAFIKKEAAEEASKVSVFYGELMISGNLKRTCAAMIDRIVPQVMEVLIKKYSPDLFFFIIRHFIYNNLNLNCVIDRIISSDKINIPKCIFSTNH